MFSTSSSQATMSLLWLSSFFNSGSLHLSASGMTYPLNLDLNVFPVWIQGSSPNSASSMDRSNGQSLIISQGCQQSFVRYHASKIKHWKSRIKNHASKKCFCFHNRGGQAVMENSIKRMVFFYWNLPLKDGKQKDSQVTKNLLEVSTKGKAKYG